MARPKIAEEIRGAIAERLRSDTQPRMRALAREFGVSPATVHRIASETGASGVFDRSATQKATQAAVADNAAGIQALAARLEHEAGLLLDSLHSPYLVFNFGGGANTYNEHLLTEPPIEAKRQIFTMAAIAVDKVLKVRAETRGSQGNGSAFELFLGLLAERATDGQDYSTP